MYVERDLDSNIIKVFARKQYDEQEFIEGAELSTPNATRITKLQAVMFFQANAINSQVDALISADAAVKARYDAAWEFTIDNPDIIALAAAVEQLTGKDLQTMFNEAAAL